MIKHCCSVLVICMTLIMVNGCKKDAVLPGSSALTIINAIVGSKPLIANFSGSESIPYANAPQLGYGKYSASTNEFGYYTGNIKLGLYQYPDTTAKSTPLYNLVLNLPPGTIHTLYLTGSVSAPDTMFMADYPPYHPFSDSSVGVRFVNLSFGSKPININIKGNASGSEVNSLPYKGLSAFKNYPATVSVSSYIFEFRDAVSGALLGNFTMIGINNGAGTNTSTNAYRFKNFTIAFKGVPGGTGTSAQGTFLINNY